MEFEIFKIPRPDLVIYLEVPIEFSQKLMAEEKSEKKKYQKGKKDLHEADANHLLNAKKSALKMIEEKNNWIKIDCIKKENCKVWKILENWFGKNLIL